MATAIAASPPALLPKQHQQPEQKTFKRIRSSLENTLRTATRSRARSPTPEGREDARSSSMIRKLEKVTFRRGAKPPNEDVPITPFTAPSLRMAAASTPALHHHPASSSKSSPAPPLPSRTDAGPRERRSSAQPSISTPQPLSPKRGHRSTASVPVVPLTPRTPSTSRRQPLSSSPPPTPSALRRVSADRHTTPSPPPSPTPKVRLRERSPSQRVYSANRLYNTSNLSLAAIPNPSATSLSNVGASSSSPPLPSSPSSPLPLSPEREAIRTASTLLLKELRSMAKHKDWSEVEVRIQALARAERVWGKSSAHALSAPTHGSEERERKLFLDAVKDGYVLCFLINKLSPRPVVLPSPSPSSSTSNVHKFLAACSSYGLLQEDLFQADDLLSSDDLDLAKVAHTITALVQHVPSRIYTNSRAASSTPNLGRSSSKSSNRGPPSPTRERIPPDRVQGSSPTRERGREKRWSPSSGLPTVRSDSPNELDRPLGSRQSGSKAQCGNDGDSPETTRIEPKKRHRGSEPLKLATRADVLTPPLRSPLRAHSPSSSSPSPTPGSSPPLPRRSSSSLAPSAPVAIPRLESSRDSIATTNTRQSVMSDTTTYSSLLEPSRVRASSNVTKFGTIRTVTTDVTSVDDGEGQDHDEVVEQQQEKKRTPPREKPKLYLGKGKWPDDFILTPPKEDADNIFGRDNDDDDGLFASSPVPVSPIQPAPNPSVLSLAQTSSSISVSRSSTPTSGSPRKLAIVGVPRRPSHRSRHSVDAPILKTASGLRDASPDGVPIPPPKVMLRRHSTKPNYHLAPRNLDDGLTGSSSPVPFPRTSSGEHKSETPLSSSPPERPRLYRGRFQSEIDGAGSRRRPRPNSYDDGGGDRRSRIESMGHIGAVSPGTERASDLLRSDSVDVVRKTLVIKEPGKPPTHFQLGNCIGRGQFGSVYRALNLNTGQMVAVKRIRLEGLKEEEVTQLMKEVDLVKSLSHPSIVKYEGMARDHDTLSIVLEFAENGSLGQTLKAFGKLNERLVASYVIKILEGLDYLHSSGVVHCDLKAANILTTKNGNVKLSDFGVSLNMRAMEKESGVGGTGHKTNHAKSGAGEVAGTPNWMAPEVIELKGASPKSDIWSLGCTVVELLTGRPPYAEVGNSMSVMFRIVEDDQPPIPDDCTPLLREFLLQCFQKDPTKRPSAVELCEHQWLKKNWSGHKELRPQDSIPFLRRVSADLQKSEVARYLSQIEMPEESNSKPEPSGSPPKIRHVRSSQQSLADRDAISPREHAFVKTTFSKPMVCRVCLLHVKKSAVLCAQCSLIAHSKCSGNAPPTCDLRAQLLLYAQYAEKGNPSSAYSNPVDAISDALPKSPMSDVSYVAGSPRTSIDQPRPHATRPVPIPSHSSPPAGVPQTPTAGSPPPAFKFMAHFKRSRSNLAGDAQQAASAPDLNKREDTPVRSKSRRERPESISSDSTNRNSSIRSSATGKKSVYSANSNLADVAEGEPTPAAQKTPTDSPPTATASKPTVSIPGEFLPEDGQNTRRQPHKRHVQSKSSGNCTVQ